MKKKTKGKVNKNNRKMEDLKMANKGKQVNNLDGMLIASVLMSQYATIISNGDSVQEKLIEILTSFWEKCGFDTSFINDKEWLESLHELVFEEAFMYSFAEDLINGSPEANEWMETMAETFVNVLACTTREIKEFNKLTSVDEKQSTFVQVLWLISYFNRYNRIGLMNILSSAIEKIECEEGIQRVFLLGEMLWESKV
ncbi:MAG: hypothetical protein IJ419_14725 [Agathobacter sp.]|nr:hypothetical protein [Agathobacter sp.]